MAVNAVFNGNSLQTSQILLSQIDGVADFPTLNVSIYPVDHANRSAIPFESFPSRPIKLIGQLYAGGSISGLDSLIDTFKGYLLGIDKNLDVDYAGGTRRFVATLNKCAIARPNWLGFANFTIEFVCSQPFGQNTATTTALSAAGRTAANYTDSHTFVGTAPYQLPVTTITFTALTGGTGATVSFGNAGNGQGINITRTWLTGDVLVIDCTLKTVTVNGIQVNFVGAFPEFPPGSQSMQYTDSLTTRTFTISSVYFPGYL